MEPPHDNDETDTDKAERVRGWKAALTGIGPSVDAEAQLVVDVMISDAVATAERVMMLSMFDTPERRLAKALLMVHRPALRDEVEEHERQRIRKQCLAPSEPTLEASIPPGFVNGAINRAVDSVRSRIAERDPRRTDAGLSYRHVDRNSLASPAAEAEMRRRFGDGDGSIPGVEPERHRDGDPLHNHEDMGYHPDSCPRCKLGAVNGPKVHTGPRATDARLADLARQYETIALNAASAAELRGLAIELIQHRKQLAQAKGFDPNSVEYKLEKLGDRADVAAARVSKLEAEVSERWEEHAEKWNAWVLSVGSPYLKRLTNLEAARDHDAVEIHSAHVRLSDLEPRIHTIEEMAAAVPVGKADPGWGSSPLPLMWGNMKIPPGSFPAAFPGDLREVPRRGIRGGRSSNLSSGGMPKMSDDPLEWDEQRALDRHPDLLPLLSRSAIRAALWERSEWVKPAALGDAPKPHMDSVLTVGELDDIRKTCETYSSDSCWRKLLAAFDATTASLKAARERFNDELGKAIDGVKRDLVEQKAQTDRWMRKESEAIHSSIPYRDAVREIFQMTGNPEGDPARAVEIVRRIREVNARARAKAQPKELTVDPDSDFAKIARGETPSFSFEVTTVPNVPDRVEMVFGRNGAPATTIRHRNGCTAGDCLGCGVTPALAAEAADDNARIAESLERSGPRLYAEQSAAGRAEASAHVLSLEDFRTAIRAVSEGGVVSAGAIASFLVECYGPRTKGVVVELRDMLVKRAELTCFPQLPAWQATQPEIDLLASVLVELDKLIAAAIKDVSAAVGRIEARPEDDIPF